VAELLIFLFDLSEFV